MEEQSFDLIFESLQNDVAQVSPTLKQIAETIIDEGISEYPVFVATQELIDVGKPIFDREEVQLNWFFNASILEDFQRKDIVKGENLLEFKRAYGDPKEKACIFVITPEMAHFVFVPYVEEK